MALATAGCGDTGQDRISVPLRVAGTESTDGWTDAAGSVIAVERAELAFGPLYLCAGQQAGELCETARLEWLESVVVDVVDGRSAEAGQLEGVSGTVRSYMFDYGITSLLARETPLVLPAAEALSDTSLRVDGIVATPAGDLPMSVAVTVAAGAETERGVPVVRKSQSEIFELRMDAATPGLTVTFDGASWLSGVDFAGFVEDGTCAPDGPARVCEGTTELSCGADGTVVGRRDCMSDGRICVAERGCADRVVIETPEDPGYRSIVNALVAGRRPEFEIGGRP